MLAGMLLCALLVTAPASGATRQQYAAKCRNAWTGKLGTKAYVRYRKRCIPAARDATNYATDRDSFHIPLKVNRRLDASAASDICDQAFRKKVSGSGPRHFRGLKNCIRAAIASQRAFALPALQANLNGANESGGGDPDGTAVADLQINPDEGGVRVDMSFDKLLTPTALEIHKAPAGSSGDVAVKLQITALGVQGGCQCKALLVDIRQHPEQYYLDVHTSDFPDGAIRGQLAKGRARV